MDEGKNKGTEEVYIAGPQRTIQDLQMILSSISCGILQYRKSDYKILLANKAALQLLGYPTVEELQKNFANGVASSVLLADRKQIADTVKGLTKAGDVRQVEYRVERTGSGEIRYCYGTAQVFYDADGECIVQRSIMDITDRKKNDDLTRRLDAVLGGISGGLLICYDDGVYSYAYASENVAAIQGYTVEELRAVSGGTALGNIIEEDRELVRFAIEKQYEEGDVYSVRYRVRHRDGTIRWVLDSGKRVMDTDGSFLHYSLIQDITETQEKNERLDNLLTMQEQMVQSLSCGVFAYTLPDYEVLLANEELKRLFRLEEWGTEEVGLEMAKQVVPEDRPLIYEIGKKLKKTGDFYRCKLRVSPDGGKVTVVDTFAKRQIFEDGRPFVLCVMQDVTKEEELQASLNREKRIYREALRHGCECCFTFDVTTGVVSEPVMTAHGIDIVESVGLSLPVDYDELSRRFLEKNQVRVLDGSTTDCFFCGEMQKQFERGITSFEAEYYVPLQFTYYRTEIIVSRDEDNGHLYGLYFSRDITEIQIREEERRNELDRARRKLEESNAELQAALVSEQEKTEVIGAISNIYYTIYHINLKSRHFEKISGGFMEGMTKNCTDMADAFANYIQYGVREDYWDQMTEFMDFDTLPDRIFGEKIISTEYQNVFGRWVRDSFIEAKRDSYGQTAEVLFVSEWIDEEKKNELAQKQALKEAYDAAKRASEAKTEFLSSMSHDIRTPMNAIIGMTAIAGTHIDDKERVADCLSKIAVSSKHLLGLINEVLDMNKIESGKLDLCMEEFNLSDLVENLLTMTKPQIEGKHHELKVNIHNVEHENVIGDSQRIQQVFMNLMGNAVKYTPEGGKIELSISEKPTNHNLIGCYVFVFKDNGIGMSEDFLPQIFDPFTRAEDNYVKQMQGTGLGMAISMNIVRMMDGDIKVESKLGEGTTFTVTIFLGLQNHGESAETENLVDLPVLVVDDDEISCETTCLVLEDLGMKGEWTLSGREAVERVVSRHENGNDFFAVILDWRMPDMDGIATTKEIRRRVGDEVPIIIISAYDWSDIEAEARAAGANAFLSKPLFKSRVIHLFQTLIGGGEETAAAINLEKFGADDYHGKRVLLVEDNELNAEIAGEILGMSGLEVEYAVNGKDAVDKIAEAEDDYYDMVFMDIQMPVMNGYEATRAIRSLDRNYAKRVPIVAMTANAFAEDVQMAKNAGMNEHIAKPLDFEDLQKSLRRWLV